jgi:hypothetical protein
MLAAHAAKRFDFGIEISTGWEILSTAARILAQDHPNPGLFQAFFQFLKGTPIADTKNRRAVAVVTSSVMTVIATPHTSFPSYL